MKKKLFLVTITLLVTFHSYSQDIHSRLDSLMDFYVREYNFNGVALVASKGKILLEHGYGYKDIGKSIRHDDNSIFEVASVTAPFTAEVVLQLVSEHKLSLDDRLEKFFPGYPKGDSILIRDLLSNTSGIVDYFMFDGFFAKHDSLHVSKDTVMMQFNKQPPRFKPGSRFQYSNSNFYLLGEIIEQVTHKSYATNMRDRIFIPSGMKNSGFDFRGLKSKNKSTGYKQFREREPRLAKVTDSTLTGGAASLYTTADDLYAWHRALQSYKLLPKHLQDSAYLPVLRNYAYGWYVDTVYDKISVIHGGQIDGFSSYLLRIPSDDLCIVLLQNINLPAFDNNGIGHSILDAIYDQDFKLPSLPPAVEVSSDALKIYEGDYVFGSGVTLVVTVDGNKLHAHNIPLKGSASKANDDFELTPIGDGKFKTKSLHAIIEFTGNTPGNITGIILHQPRHDIAAKKKVDKQ